MIEYTDKEIQNITANFKIDELKRILEMAENDYSILPRFIDAVKKQIEELSGMEYTKLLILENNYLEKFKGYTILLANAPVKMDINKIGYNCKDNLEVIREFSYMEKEQDIAVSCCEELIRKYSIPRDRVIAREFAQGKQTRWIESVLDDIYNGKSYIEKKMRKLYKSPDRIDKKLGYNIDEETGSIERELGSYSDVLSDGRPYRAECWSEDEYTFITFFFSTVGIETYEGGEFTKLLQPQLSLYNVLQNHGNPEATVIRDESANRMWSVTYLLREDD